MDRQQAGLKGLLWKDSERRMRHSAQFEHLGDIAGAGERIRTSDLLITNQLLCQLSYASLMPGPNRL